MEKQPERCPNCGGDGDDPDDLSGIAICVVCHGTGFVPHVGEYHAEGLDERGIYGGRAYDPGKNK